MHSVTLPGPGYPLAIASHLREHLLWMRLQGRMEDTLVARRRAVVLLGEHLRIDPARATFADLYGWQLWLLGNTSLSTVRHQTSLIRPYYSWLHALGHRGDNPAALLPVPKARRGLPRPIAEPKLTRAITEAPPRLLPWLLLAGWSGLRAAEIAERFVEDFFCNDDGAWVRVIGKGEVTRDVPIPDFAWPSIADALPAGGRAWRMVRGPGKGIKPVTPNHVSQYCNRFLRKIGIPDELHALRHRVATDLYNRTNDQRLVQDFLGHANANTTAIYTRVNPSRMFAAVNAVPHPELPTPPGARHLRAVRDAHGGTA